MISSINQWLFKKTIKVLLKNGISKITKSSANYQVLLMILDH